MSDPPATFQTRLKSLMQGTYLPNMRRSVQTVVLYEADRCLKAQYKLLRPFQRKIALHDAAADLANTLDWIPGGHKSEVMFRTASGKKPLSPELAWRRMKLIDREIAKTIIPGVKPFMGPDVTHQQACDAYIQSQFILISKSSKVDNDGGDNAKETPVPSSWEYSHISVFLAYRMYYDGEAIATDLPPPIDPNPSRKVPRKKPKEYPPPPLVSGALPSVDGGDGNVSDELQAYAGQLDSVSPVRGRTRGIDDTARRAMLKEVKDHLDVIKDLEGIMPAAEAEQRKRALYAAMPPPPGPYKRARTAIATAPVPAAVASPPKKKKAAKVAAAAAAAAAAAPVGTASTAAAAASAASYDDDDNFITDI